jgi:hypothetical protein
MAVFGETFNQARGAAGTLVHQFKSTPSGSGRYLLAFAERENLVVLRQHTRTREGLVEVAVGFTTEQLLELQSLLPALIEESRFGRTPDHVLTEVRERQRRDTEQMEDGPAKKILQYLCSLNLGR